MNGTKTKILPKGVAHQDPIPDIGSLGLLKAKAKDLHSSGICLRYPAANGKQYVLKGDFIPRFQLDQLRLSLKFIADLFREVTVSSANLRVLEPGENSTALHLLSDRDWSRAKDHQDFNRVPLFYIMDSLPWLMTLDDLAMEDEKDTGIDKVRKVRMLFTIEKNPEIMMALGRIVAVDLYTGNTDRFFWSMIKGSRKWEFKPTNVFFMSDDAGELVNCPAIDVFDATTDGAIAATGANFYKVPNLSDASKRKYALGNFYFPHSSEHLADSQGKFRDQMAQEIIALLTEHLKKNPFHPVRFGAKHLEAFREGLHVARGALKEYVKGVAAWPTSYRPLLPGIAYRQKSANW
jgi:hypothetical protein